VYVERLINYTHKKPTVLMEYDALSVLANSLGKCSHGTLHRGISCSSYISLDSAPTFIDEVKGYSHNSTHKQPMSGIIQACEAYFMLRALELVRQSEDNMVTKVESVGDRFTPYSGPVAKRFEVMLTQGASCEGKDVGLIVHRPVARASEYVGSIEDRIKSVQSPLTSIKWWVIPLSVEEVMRKPACLNTFEYSLLMLPVGCGKEVTKLCLVGFRGSELRRPYWESMNVGSLGWYNSYVRTVRVPPDMCRECWIMKGLFLTNSDS